MSRSYRKPYHENPDGSHHVKKDFNSRVRHHKDVMPDGSFYKKANDIWPSILEAKGYWDIPKLRRK